MMPYRLELLEGVARRRYRQGHGHSLSFLLIENLRGESSLPQERDPKPKRDADARW
jgi:hypothetical protein